MTTDAPSADRTVVASYSDYSRAQRAVDFLSDEKFPVEHVAIIGTGLKLVETVTGRLTAGRAALAGASAGLWFGVLIGLFVAIFSTGTDTWALILWGAIWGLIAGAVFSLIAYAFTGGRRDFVSFKELRADTYDIAVNSSHAEAARSTLSRLT
jgi:hypothetical protein